MKKNILAIAALSAVVIATAVWSQGGSPQGKPFPGRPEGMRGFMMSCPAMAIMPPRVEMMDHMSKTLQLTSSQVAKLKQIFAKNDKIIHPLMQKAAQASKALREAVLAAKYDAKHVKSLAVNPNPRLSIVVEVLCGNQGHFWLYAHPRL